jgi:hypothetical protein
VVGAPRRVVAVEITREDNGCYPLILLDIGCYCVLDRRECPNVTAIKIWTADSQFLIFSVYLLCVPLLTPNEALAELALTAIQNTHKR